MVAVVDVRVGHNVVVALHVKTDFVVVVVVIVQIVRDVCDDREDVHGGGQEGHLGQADCGCISRRGATNGTGITQR